MKSWKCQACGHEHELKLKTEAPKWVEASATSADGKVYWARVDARIDGAEFMAQNRAEYLARVRTKTPRPY